MVVLGWVLAAFPFVVLLAWMYWDWGWEGVAVMAAILVGASVLSAAGVYGLHLAGVVKDAPACVCAETAP